MLDLSNIVKSIPVEDESPDIELVIGAGKEPISKTPDATLQERVERYEKLVNQFNTGKLPLKDGRKLKDYLATLKAEQAKRSRLSKKLDAQCIDNAPSPFTQPPVTMEVCNLEEVDTQLPTHPRLVQNVEDDESPTSGSRGEIQASSNKENSARDFDTCSPAFAKDIQMFSRIKKQQLFEQHSPGCNHSRPSTPAERVKQRRISGRLQDVNCCCKNTDTSNTFEHKNQWQKQGRQEDIGFLPASPSESSKRLSCLGVVRSSTSGRRNVKRTANDLPAGQIAESVMVLSDDEDDVNKGTGPVTSGHVQQRMGLRSTIARNAHKKIAYPSRGDPDAVEVSYSDMQCLNPMEFLNDTIIDFYIRYIQREELLPPERKQKFYFFSSFFFKKLMEIQVSKKPQATSEEVVKLRKWTRGINIFEKSYLIVPVHDKLHWSLVIVCFSAAEDAKYAEPYVYHLDSLDNGHSTRDAFKYLDRYLKVEYMHNFGEECKYLERVKRVQVPLQTNEYDCGLFLLYYIERFVKDAPLPFDVDATEKMFGKTWFKSDAASNTRHAMRKLLEDLFMCPEDCG